MSIVISIIASILMIFLFRRIQASLVFTKEVKKLFDQSKYNSTQVYHQHQLDRRPEPNQRYFKNVLIEGQPYISYARIRHMGQFKTGIDKNWITIKGEQYATTEKPGFIWKGTTSMFVARDMYIAEKERMVVSLFSVFNVVNAKGDVYEQGELLRWLCESVMYPTNFLPSNRLSW